MTHKGRWRFTRTLVGWEFVKFGEMDYWLVITGDENEPGINGRASLPRQRRSRQEERVHGVRVHDRT